MSRAKLRCEEGKKEMAENFASTKIKSIFDIQVKQLDVKLEELLIEREKFAHLISRAAEVCERKEMMFERPLTVGQTLNVCSVEESMIHANLD